MVVKTRDGRAFRILTIPDEYARGCLKITVARRITAEEVIHQLAGLSIGRGIPEHIRSGNGADLTARVIREWLDDFGGKTLYIEPGNPWENG
jgi:putative transposase